eukprot:6473183-Pyramimonas_sp.AAC.1
MAVLAGASRIEQDISLSNHSCIRRLRAASHPTGLPITALPVKRVVRETDLQTYCAHVFHIGSWRGLGRLRSTRLTSQLADPKTNEDLAAGFSLARAADES